MEGKQEALTVAIAHQQHSMVDEPRAAEGPEWMSNPMAIELRRKQGTGGKLKGEMRKAQMGRDREVRTSPACRRH